MNKHVIFIAQWKNYMRNMQKAKKTRNNYLAKLGDGLNESPTVMVGDNNNKTKK